MQFMVARAVSFKVVCLVKVCHFEYRCSDQGLKMGAGASSVPAIKDALKDVSDAQISGIISKLSAETRTKMLLALEATDDIAQTASEEEAAKQKAEDRGKN